MAAAGITYILIYICIVIVWYHEIRKLFKEIKAARDLYEAQSTLNRREVEWVYIFIACTLVLIGFSIFLIKEGIR